MQEQPLTHMAKDLKQVQKLIRNGRNWEAEFELKKIIKALNRQQAARGAQV